MLDRRRVMRKICVGALMVALLVGCATRQSVEQDGVGNTFESSLAPTQLARCMVRNIDGKALGSLKGSIEPADDRIDVVVRNGDNIWALVKIQKRSPGSNAAMLYGGAGKMDIETSRKWLVTGCD
jgi:hypothetical protein